MKFSEIEITEERYELYLGETGLYARVNPTGSISIYYKYSVDGTRSKLPLGKYPGRSRVARYHRVQWLGESLRGYLSDTLFRRLAGIP